MFRSRKNKEGDKRAFNFIESFKSLSLAGEERLRAKAGTGAATSPIRDGFASASSPHLPVASDPRPPHPNDAAWIPPPPVLYPSANNVSQSLTMQHAIAGFTPSGVPTTPPPRVPHRPVARPSLTPAGLYDDTPAQRARPEPLAPLPPPSSRGGQAQTPQPPKVRPPPMHRRAQSEPPSPVASGSASAVGGTSQCCGMTAAGKRCRNQVKVSDAQAFADGDVFCRVHGNKVGEVSGFYDRKTGQTFVKFGDWIPDYLQPATQNALRVEMQKARAASDVEGYIYTFEILDPADRKTIHLKVGRATNLNRRMDQWGKQCGSKEQILRGFWPGGMDKAGVPMKGLVQAGPKGPWCHRVERLVHIELTDLVEHTPYLDERYPNVAANKEVKKGGKKDVKRCPDCNTKHKEIFSFERVMEGRYEGKEWEDIVKPVIEKWGGFVEAYL